MNSGKATTSGDAAQLVDQPITDTDPSDPASYMRELRARILNEDPLARQALERIVRFSMIESLVAEAKRSDILQEYQFASSLPLVGRFVSGVRSAINSLATKWVVQSLIRQQNKFNAATARALGESVELNRWLLERVETLEARVAKLEREQYN